ncbi:hypothetical protein AAFF_G00293830 [Aldrovandia affinis]|uniref:EF-hand domain-containing protein n=1 Tax=Aldrovandia affinis TaxID=143900 RepID=A0AAD7W0Q6_9TELE|nr:hypothetical protein AAFF_G00293830 [Aldrovandia affinis]
MEEQEGEIEAIQREMREEEKGSPAEEEKGDVLSSLTEESGDEKIKEKRESEENRSSDHSSAKLDQSESSTIAGYLEAAKLQDTELHFSCEGEISAGRAGGDQGQPGETGVKAHAEDTPADTMASMNINLAQDTSLPVPTERRRKLGSSRKSSHRAKMQTERGEEWNVMGPERGEGEEMSLLEEELVSQTTASPGEIHREQQMEQKSDNNTDQLMGLGEEMRGDVLVGLMEERGSQKSEEKEEERSKEKGQAVISSIQSPAVLELPEDSGIAGQQDISNPLATQLPSGRKKLGSRRKVKGSVWKRERSLGQTEESGVEDPNIAAVLKRIEEVFHHWDTGEKGFITWEEMQGLGSELDLSSGDLQQVFDRLDVDRDGLVTPQDFSASFREFMHFQQPEAGPVTCPSHTSIPPEGVDDNEREHFLSMLDDLGAYNLLQDQSEMWRLWVELRHKEPHLLHNLEDFVSKVTEQIKTVQQEKECLELALKRRVQQHNAGVQELYEEMERQIGSEKERVKKESLKKSRFQLAEVEGELDKKNKEIQGLIAVQTELERSLQGLRRRQQQTSEENKELCRTNQELEGQLERIRGQLESTQGQLQETLSHVQAKRSSISNRQCHPQLKGLASASGAAEIASRPEVLNVDSNAESEKGDVSHDAVVLERSGSVLDHYFQQDSYTGPPKVKGDAPPGRMLSTEEDPLPDLVNPIQAPPRWHQGDALWEKQRGQARGERHSLTRSLSTPDVLYNVVLVGDSSVGKTSFMKRFQSAEFSMDHSATIGLDSCIQTLQVEGTRVIVQLWDTAGQERYRSITKQILRKAHGLLLMYDITSSQSFLAVHYWLSSIKEGAPDDVIIMLLGNKNDSGKREVPFQEGERLAREYSIHFMECSAATGHNVPQSMDSLARTLKRRVDDKQEGNFSLNKEPPKKKSGCC